MLRPPAKLRDRLAALPPAQASIAVAAMNNDYARAGKSYRLAADGQGGWAIHFVAPPPPPDPAGVEMSGPWWHAAVYFDGTPVRRIDLLRRLELSGVEAEVGMAMIRAAAVAPAGSAPAAGTDPAATPPAATVDFSAAAEAAAAARAAAPADRTATGSAAGAAAVMTPAGGPVKAACMAAAEQDRRRRWWHKRVYFDGQVVTRAALFARLAVADGVDRSLAAVILRHARPAR